MRCEWFSVSRVNSRPIAARSMPGTVDAAREQGAQRVPFGGDALRLRERLPHQPPAPEREPAAQARVGRDGGAHPVHDEHRLPRVREASAMIVRVSASRNAAISR